MMKGLNDDEIHLRMFIIDNLWECMKKIYGGIGEYLKHSQYSHNLRNAYYCGQGITFSTVLKICKEFDVSPHTIITGVIKYNNYSLPDVLTFKGVLETYEGISKCYKPESLVRDIASVKYYLKKHKQPTLPFYQLVYLSRISNKPIDDLVR